MRCPHCENDATRVIDSRDLENGSTIRRRRECEACGHRFTTYERPEGARLVVVKRDGSREEFEREFPDWQWSPQAASSAAAFEAGVAHLHRYVAVHGTSNARHRAVINGFAIGQWVANRRADYRRGTMPAERARRLEAEFDDWRWTVRGPQGLRHGARSQER